MKRLFYRFVVFESTIWLMFFIVLMYRVYVQGWTVRVIVLDRIILGVFGTSLVASFALALPALVIGGIAFLVIALYMRKKARDWKVSVDDVISAFFHYDLFYTPGFWGWGSEMFGVWFAARRVQDLREQIKSDAAALL